MPNTVTSRSGKPLAHAAHRTTTSTTDSAAKQLQIASRQKTRRDENEEYLKNANVKAFLYMTGKSEGGDYHAKYGWYPGNTTWGFTDETTHPGVGKDGRTTAAGLYQINNAAWTEHGKKAMGLDDFSPHTQDLIAVEDIRKHNVLDAVIGGDIKTAIDKLKPHEWVSFQVHDYKTLKGWFVEGGGTPK
ncbi:paar repeat-containing protein [Paraburkholderia dinghuensis]|uniref:Paar repeat-containing protein n=1 Tax=Paraburkholderia dinghuensis TaxID=2305225 RepID=A0A3N6N5Q7_9BURK|nr:paar repeat-containing protein [Paraburkholderia dinghuensis]RQH04252.1 paar repeat-containing protein [Paraburkholderia dinghuensis]